MSPATAWIFSGGFLVGSGVTALFSLIAYAAIVLKEKTYR